MSTKTTFKRVALVAVASLGFGMLSAVPSLAATGSITVSTTSLTVVGGTGTTNSSGLFYVDTFAAGDATPLEATAESITATVIGKPTFKLDGTTAMTTGDVTIQAVKTAKTADAVFAAVGDAGAGAQQIPNGAGLAPADFSSWDGNYVAVDATTGTQNRYWFAVYPTDTDAVDAGEFTIRVRLVDSTGFISDKSIKVKFVTSAADSGAAITLAQSGAVYTGQALTYTAANKLTATVTDANGGQLVKGVATTTARSGRTPDLAVAVVLTSTGVATADSLSIADSGTAGVDHVADTDYALGVANNSTNDGHFGITAAAGGIVTTASTLYSVRVRYGSLSVTMALTLLGATTADEQHMDLTLTAAGILAGEELIKSNVDSTTTYTLPLSTKTATIKLGIQNGSDAALASQSMTTKATWSGPFVSADVSPATQTVGTTSTTDALGNISLTVSNATPLDGATATILITGFAGGLNGLTAPGTRTVKLVWAKAAVNSITVLDPVAAVKVLAGSTNVFTLLVKDQFGTAMANEPIQPAITGTTSSNYSATATQAIVTTGAAGTATWSLKDAGAIAGSDALSFTTINGSKSTTASLSYVTTLPVVNTMRVFFNRDATALAAAVTTLVPTTGIYSTDGGSTKLLITSARNYSRSLATLGSATTDDMNVYKVEALTSAGVAATGAAVTVTASAGGYVVGADNIKTTSRTFPVASTGFVSFIGGATGTGAITYTITAGTVSASAAAWMGNATADARNVTLTAGATTGEAYSAGVPMTVKVTDRFGNPVSGVTLVAVATGAGSFAGGATTQSYSTDSTGAYTFQAVSNVDGGGAATFTVTAGNATESASSAGYVLTTEVDSTLTAGNKAATATVAFSGGSSPASIAADAAAEATDAANAATDAANAAAEAADAATAAAQDAADAVAALSAQVASLISGLKAQLTALTNLVIKIQKKVKA